MGFVNYVVDPKELDAKVNEIAEKAAAGPPRALAMSKALLNRSFSNSLTDALDQEGTAQTFNFTTKDITEAMRAISGDNTKVFQDDGTDNDKTGNETSNAPLMYAMPGLYWGIKLAQKIGIWYQGRQKAKKQETFNQRS